MNRTQLKLHYYNLRDTFIGVTAYVIMIGTFAFAGYHIARACLIVWRLHQ